MGKASAHGETAQWEQIEAKRCRTKTISMKSHTVFALGECADGIFIHSAFSRVTGQTRYWRIKNGVRQPGKLECASKMETYEIDRTFKKKTAHGVDPRQVAKLSAGQGEPQWSTEPPCTWQVQGGVKIHGEPVCELCRIRVWEALSCSGTRLD